MWGCRAISFTSVVSVAAASTRKLGSPGGMTKVVFTRHRQDRREGRLRGAAREVAAGVMLKRR
jgi:hypothetical protein